MPGIRIHHPTLRGCTLLVPHPGDPRTGRKPKDYHIHLDENGDALVSETVWRRLQEAQASGLSAHGFIVLNEVPDPPTLVMSAEQPGVKRRTFRVEHDGKAREVVDDDLRAVTQRFAPKGVTPRIVTRRADG